MLRINDISPVLRSSGWYNTRAAYLYVAHVAGRTRKVHMALSSECARAFMGQAGQRG